MKRVAWASGVAFGLAQACAAVAPTPVATLPPREAPLEARVAAYRTHAAMPHLNLDGWAMRIGDGEPRGLGDARPVLANAVHAEAILQARATQVGTGRGLLLGGAAALLGAAVVILLNVDARESSLSGPLVLMGLGAGAGVAGTLVMAAGERRVPTAAEAYNDWLWEALDLPRAGRPAARTPHPAPWGAPP